MKVTILTSNQPRHLALVEALADCVDQVYAIHESTSVFPGKVQDFYNKSDVMQTYFSKVIQSEEKIFGKIRPMPSKVRQIILRMGDLNLIDRNNFKEAFESDLYIVCGASYIKGELCDYLVEKKCLNIHMGISPYYRGTATNFWPVYDDCLEYVGATIHYLTKGLDSGPILFHTLPKPEAINYFDLGMKAVQSAFMGITHHLKSNSIFNFSPEQQDKTKQIRYSKRNEFNDEIAIKFMERDIQPEIIKSRLGNRNMKLFKNPFVAF